MDAAGGGTHTPEYHLPRSKSSTLTLSPGNRVNARSQGNLAMVAAVHGKIPAKHRSMIGYVVHHSAGCASVVKARKPVCSNFERVGLNLVAASQAAL